MLIVLLSLVCLVLSIEDGHVITPFGIRREQCVLEVENNALVRPLPNGRLEIRVPGAAIRYHDPPKECGDDIDQIRKRYQEKRAFRSVNRQGKLRDGWLDYAGWYPPTPESNLQTFTGTYTVPGNPPTTTDGQTLFYFIGMQDNDAPNAVNIVQPVLTWGNGQTEWYAKSWACCPSNITVSSPPVYGLTPGSTLNGVIARVSPSTWRIDSIVTSTNQKTTLMAQVGDYQYNWADVTLEVYGIQGCQDYAPGKALFTQLVLKDQTGQVLTPSWQLTPATECGGSISQLSSNSLVIQHTNSRRH